MKEFQCPACHNALGLTDGAVLVVGAVRIEQPVILYCLACGDGQAHREWRPVSGVPPKADAKRMKNERLAERIALRTSRITDSFSAPVLDRR